MDNHFGKSHRKRNGCPFPVYVILDIIEYINTRKWLLLTQFIVTFLLAVFEVFAIKTGTGKLLFGEANAAEMVFAREFSGYLYDPAFGFLIVAVAFLWYFYQIFLEPAILKAFIKDESGFWRTEERFEHRIGMHIVYFVMIIAILNMTNSGIRSTGDNRDLAGYLSDYRLYCAGELSPELGVFSVADEPYNLEGDAKIEAVPGITYLNYYGAQDGERKCLRCPESLYQELDLTDSYTFSVTYMPYSLVVTDISPVKITEEDREKAADTFGFESLNAHEKEVLTLMYSEKLAQVWLEEQDEDALFPVFFEDTMSRQEFEELEKYYQSAVFEYPLRSYMYDMYGGTENNVFVKKQQTYFSIEGISDNFTVDIDQYYASYQESIARIAEEMPKDLDERGKILYLAQYLTDHSKPLQGQELLALEDETLIYLCANGYGPILFGYGECMAYSQALTGLLHAAGIEVIPVASGNEASGYYMNLVKMEGEWYYLDVYGADCVSNAAYIFFRDEDFGRLYGVDREVYLPRYGYTDLEVPATGTEQITAELAFTENENQSSEKIAEYRQILDDIAFETEGNLPSLETAALSGEETEQIEGWVEQMFLHVQTIEPESDEHLEFTYGENANDLAKDFFWYLAVSSAPEIYCGDAEEAALQGANILCEEGLAGLSDVIVGFPASRTILKGSQVREIYETLTGCPADGVFEDTRYETPDKTAVYEYNRDWDVFLKISETAFKDRSGNRYDGNLARGLYTYPVRVKVERITENAGGYEVVFYTDYTGYGEHYFTMQLERGAQGQLRIAGIRKRYTSS